MAWCGPLFTVCLFGGWGLLGGFIPLIPATDSAADVAQAYTGNANLHLFGLTIAMAGAFLTLPFSLVVSLQMRRADRGVPVMATRKTASGLLALRKRTATWRGRSSKRVNSLRSRSGRSGRRRSP